MLDRSKFIVGGVVIAIAALLGLRVWWACPKELTGGQHLEKIEKVGSSYTFYLKPASSLSDIADLRIFEGYSPLRHREFEESIKDRPSKYVKDRFRHYYLEYMGEYGRIQFHNDYNEEDGISQWLELLPTDLPLDAFLSKDVAIDLDIRQPEFTIYIPSKLEHTYMTVFVKKRKIDRIAWFESYLR